MEAKERAPRPGIYIRRFARTKAVQGSRWTFIAGIASGVRVVCFHHSLWDNQHRVNTSP